MCRFWIALWTGLGFLLCVITAQEDFSDPIKCYFCDGPAVNGTCGDPINPKFNSDLRIAECDYGVCVKWTRYKKGVLHMERTCSTQLNLHIMLVDGVCRSESNGNGYLCMCGKHMCNQATRATWRVTWVPLLISVSLFLYYFLHSPWLL